VRGDGKILKGLGAIHVAPVVHPPPPHTPPRTLMMGKASISDGSPASIGIHYKTVSAALKDFTLQLSLDILIFLRTK